jgi:hypothetical protein
MAALGWRLGGHARRYGAAAQPHVMEASAAQAHVRRAAGH